MLIRRIHTEKILASTPNKSIFHKTWFNLDKQTLLNSNHAIVSNDINSQIKSFHENGYVIIKKSQNQNMNYINDLNIDIMNQLNEMKSNYFFQLFRTIKEYKVRSQTNRYAIPLEMTTKLYATFTETMNNIRPFLLSQLPYNSPLVNLSSIITDPGSERQKTHSDIPQSNNKIIAGFMALSIINIENGPTMLYAGSHTKAFHTRHVYNNHSIKDEPMHYNNDGSYCEPDDKNNSTSNTTNNNHIVHEETIDETLAIDLTMTSSPHAALLHPGDVLLYDSKIFHFGGANSSIIPRPLLFFSFQECTPWGFIDYVSGYTYNCHHSVKGKYAINSF